MQLLLPPSSPSSIRLLVDCLSAGDRWTEGSVGAPLAASTTSVASAAPWFPPVPPLAFPAIVMSLAAASLAAARSAAVAVAITVRQTKQNNFLDGCRSIFPKTQPMRPQPVLEMSLLLVLLLRGGFPASFLAVEAVFHRHKASYSSAAVGVGY